MEGSACAGSAIESEGPVADTGHTPPWQPPKSRAFPLVEQDALACVRRGQRNEALKILVDAYGARLQAFALRVLRDHELAKDIRQQVFLEAFQGIERFQGRSTLWSWLCGIAYHRCLDERRRAVRAGAADDFDVSNQLVGQPDPLMDEDRVAKQRALEHCLGQLPVAMQTQVLMRYFLGLSYVEIAEVVGEPHGTIQVRLSRLLPRLRRCLHGKGVGR